MRLHRTRLLAGVVAVLAFGLAACGSAASASNEADPCTADDCPAVPALVGLSAPQAWATLARSRFAVPPELVAKGDTVTVDHQSPGAGTHVPATTPILLLFHTAPTVPVPARAVSAADWALVAQDPSAHIGERIVVYGRVTRFDGDAGSAAFRARVDGIAQSAGSRSADGGTDAVLTGAPELLRDVVVGDLFRAEVTVTGAPAAGTPVVPRLDVTAISVTGRAAD